MPRVRKAWHVVIDGAGSDYVFAPTRSKAMAATYYSLSDAWNISFKELLQVACVSRAPHRDVTLPDRHPLAGQISDKILHCVVHAYGGRGLKAGYRDHFYTSDSDPIMKAAYYHGLFDRYRVDKRMAGQSDAVMYELTSLGKRVAQGEADHYPAN